MTLDVIIDFYIKKIDGSDSSYNQYNTINWLKSNIELIYVNLIQHFEIFIKGIDMVKLVSTLATQIQLIENILMMNEMNKNLKHVFNII